jgi:hypothetical protein
MASPNTKRTLSLRIILQDLATKPLTTLSRGLLQLGKLPAAGLRGLGRLLTSIRGQVLGLVTAYAGFRGLTFLRDVGAQADALTKLATSTGDAVENLSELQAAATLSGIQDFTQLVRVMAQEQSKALAGNLQVVRSFGQLGVTIQDLRTLGPSQLFEKIADGLGKIEDANGRQFALARLATGEFLQMLPLVGRGGEAFRETVLAARDAGATVTGAQAGIAERLNDAFSKVQFAAESVARAILEQGGPQVIAVLEKLAKAIASNRAGIADVVRAIGYGIVQAVNLAIDAIIGLVRLIESIPGVNLVGDEQTNRLREIRRELKQIEDFGLQQIVLGGEKPEAQRARKAALQRELEQLTEDVDRGLAGAMQRTRETLSRELEQSIADIRRSVAGPSSPEQTAAAFGLPTPQDAADYSDAVLGQLLKGIQERANAAAPSSVFRPPTSAPTADAGTTEELSLARAREKLGVYQRLAQLSPGVESLRLAVAELDAESQKLELKDAYEKGTISQEEFRAGTEAVTRALEKQQRLVGGGDFFGGFSAGIRRGVQEWTDFEQAGLEAGRSLVTNALDGTVEAIGSAIEGTKSWKDAFKDLARSILGDIARIIARLIALQAVQAVLGYATGGISPGPIENTYPVRAFARGGIADRPTMAVFGEGRQREAFVPLPDNRSIPVTLNGTSGTNLTFNINAMNGRDVKRVLIEEQATLRTIWTNQVETRHGMRQVLQRATG